jgi:hypothetical protein
MADFAIRVELQGYPTREQYEVLHALMARKGFHQTVNGTDAQGNQKRFTLPHATYYGSSVDSCGGVRDSILKAVQTEVQKDIVVFAVETRTWAWGR